MLVDIWLGGMSTWYGRFELVGSRLTRSKRTTGIGGRVPVTLSRRQLTQYRARRFWSGAAKFVAPLPAPTNWFDALPTLLIFIALVGPLLLVRNDCFGPLFLISKIN